MCPRSEQQFINIRIQSKSSIEEAALELFGHQGYANTSISEIARKAGISKGLIYNYFKSKDELLKTIVVGAIDKGNFIFDNRNFGDIQPAEILSQMIDSVIYMLKNNLSYWKLVTSLSFQDEVMSELKDVILQKANESISGIEPIFEKLGYPEPKSQAFLFGAAMDGISLHYITLGQHYPLDQSVKSLKNLFCKTYQK